ncbi:hypothetical protein DL98DRAFT_593735 [Cadophora sp. DSE1049]|nr:hypothetical protein DL98DRAFT_593735 [Cadophora sp. DSE1049]
MRNVEFYTPQVKHEPTTLKPEIGQPFPSKPTNMPKVGAPGVRISKSAKRNRRARKLAEAANAAQVQSGKEDSDSSYTSRDKPQDDTAQLRHLDLKLDRELEMFQTHQTEALARFKEEQQVEWEPLKASLHAQKRRAELMTESRRPDSRGRSPSRSGTNRNDSSRSQRDNRRRSASPDRERMSSTKENSKGGKNAWWKDRKKR